MTTRVHIEYCGTCGFEPRYLELQKDIRKAVPRATVTGAVGRPNSFEITLNDQIIFSRLQQNVFPDPNLIIQQVQQACDQCCKGESKEGNVPVTGLPASTETRSTFGSATQSHAMESGSNPTFGNVPVQGISSFQQQQGSLAGQQRDIGLTSTHARTVPIQVTSTTTTTSKVIGQPSTYGQSSALGQTSTYGQPSMIGQSSTLPARDLKKEEKLEKKEAKEEAKEEKPKSTLKSGYELGLQQGPAAGQQREYRFVKEEPAATQNTSTFGTTTTGVQQPGQEGSRMGHDHPYGPRKSTEEQGDVPIVAGQARNYGTLGSQNQGNVPVLGLGATQYQGTGANQYQGTGSTDQARLVPTEYQQQEFEKFKQAGRIPNQQDLGQRDTQTRDFMGTRQIDPLATQQPTQPSTLQPSTLQSSTLQTEQPQPLATTGLLGPQRAINPPSTFSGGALGPTYGTQQPIIGAPQPILGAQQPGLVSQSKSGRRSSTSSSSSEDAGHEKLSPSYKKERHATIDQPGVTADKKHNLDVDQVRGPRHVRRENVREQT